jgi:hypothetical protein
MILRGSAVFRYTPSGAIAGFDLPTILSITEALGHDTHAMLRLLDYAQTGLREAMNNHGNSDTEHIHPHSGS